MLINSSLYFKTDVRLSISCSDSFARLYDRRMLPSLSSCRKTMSPPPCVNYFCPMHLSDRVSHLLDLYVIINS